MSFTIRPMERSDLTAVSRLLAETFPQGLTVSEWEETLEWLYFSSQLDDIGPRGLVLSREAELAGHVGLTSSTLTDGTTELKVVQTVNWAVDRSQNPGLWSLKLLQQANARLDAAIIVGGGADTQKLVPRLGFVSQPDVGRYIKVLRPWSFVRSGHSRRTTVRSLAKCALSVTRRVAATARSDDDAAGPALTWRVTVDSSETEVNEQNRLVAPASWQHTFRNALDPNVLAWYQACPRGDVCVLDFLADEKVVGRTVMMIRQHDHYPFATVLGIDATTEELAVWARMAAGIEAFAHTRRATHINALASFAPWCGGLERRGFHRLKTIPFWLLDKSGALASADAWHLTAMEGGLGYLFP